jgi:hypothetical protein
MLVDPIGTNRHPEGHTGDGASYHQEARGSTREDNEDRQRDLEQ